MDSWVAPIFSAVVNSDAVNMGVPISALVSALPFGAYVDHFVSNFLEYVSVLDLG